MGLLRKGSKINKDKVGSTQWLLVLKGLILFFS